MQAEINAEISDIQINMLLSKLFPLSVSLPWLVAWIFGGVCSSIIRCLLRAAVS